MPVVEGGREKRVAIRIIVFIWNCRMVYMHTWKRKACYIEPGLGGECRAKAG